MIRYLTIYLLLSGIFARSQNYVLDPTFGTNGTQITETDLLPSAGDFKNGKYYLFGNSSRIARYNYNGLIDTTFGNNGIFIFSVTGQSLKLKNFKIYNDKIYSFGYTEGPGVLSNAIIFRLTSDGQPDTTFGNNGIVQVDLGQIESFNDILINTDNTIFAIGTAQQSATDGRVLVCKFLADGSPDTVFNGTGLKVFPYTQDTKGLSMWPYEDGFLLGNWTKAIQFYSKLILQKIDGFGNLMPGFGVNGEIEIQVSHSVSSYSGSFKELKLVGNKVYINYGYNNMYSYDAIDAFDISNPGSLLFSIGIYSNSFFYVFDSGKILYARGIACPNPSCVSDHFTIQQYNSDGTLDPTFDGEGIYSYYFPNSGIGEGATFVYAHDDGRIFSAGASCCPFHPLSMLRIGLPSLAVENFNVKNEFYCYPIPASDILYIRNESNDTIDDVFITDISGKKFAATIERNNGISISSFNKGIYFLTFKIKGNLHTIKFVK